jgi:hypothetical protein
MYSGRLANKDARLANIKLGFTFTTLPPSPPSPTTNLPTGLELAFRSTSLALAASDTSLELEDRATETDQSREMELVIDG